MKLHEAVKFTNKKNFVSKVAYRMINDWKKIWKPGKKVGLDVEGIIMNLQRLYPELVKGDPESWGNRQYKDVVKLATREAYNFPFKNPQQTEDFNVYLKKALQRL